MTDPINKAQGQAIQVSFEVFRQLLLQLQPNFVIKALKAQVTLEVVDAVIVEVEEEVAVVSKGAVDEEFEEVT